MNSADPQGFKHPKRPSQAWSLYHLPTPILSRPSGLETSAAGTKKINIGASPRLPLALRNWVGMALNVDNA